MSKYPVPLNDYILIQLDQVDDKTTGGVIILEDSKDQPETAEVLVGNDDVKPGDYIVVLKYGGIEVDPEFVDGKENCKFIPIKDVVGILERKE